jgi:hypothetical protein
MSFFENCVFAGNFALFLGAKKQGAAGIPACASLQGTKKPPRREAVDWWRETGCGRREAGDGVRETGGRAPRSRLGDAFDRGGKLRPQIGDLRVLALAGGTGGGSRMADTDDRDFGGRWGGGRGFG